MAKLYAFAFIVLVAALLSTGLFSSIIHFFESLFGMAKSTLLYGPGASKLTIYFSNGNQYILGLANYTVISATNTTVYVPQGIYQFQLGYTTTANHTAKTQLYAYNMTVRNTTAIIAVKPNNTIQWLNIGNGTFSVSRSIVLLNQS